MNPLLIFGGLGVGTFLVLLTKNILTGTFSVSKFFSGFAFWQGAVMGKLIYYIIIFSIVAAVALGIYHRFTQETYSNDYRNNVKGENVIIDQRQIFDNKSDAVLIGIKLFGLRIGVSVESKVKPNTVTNNNEVKETKKEEIKPIVKGKK